MSRPLDCMGREIFINDLVVVGTNSQLRVGIVEKLFQYREDGDWQITICPEGQRRYTWSLDSDKTWVVDYENLG